MRWVMIALLAIDALAAQAARDVQDEKLQALIDRATGLRLADHHGEAAEAFAEAAALAPEDTELAYHAARCYSLAGRKKEALHHLRAAVTRGFLDVERLANDADLTPLKGEKDFHAAIGAAHAQLAAIDHERARAARRDMLAALGRTDPCFVFNFDLYDVSGGRVALELLRGRAVIAGIFTTGTPVCRSEAKLLIQVAKKYAADDPAIVCLFMEYAAPQDAPEAIARFAGELGLAFPCAYIDETVVAQIPAFRGPPMLLFFDKEGALRLAHAGTTSLAMYTGWLDELLGKGATGANVPVDANGQPRSALPAQAK
jgi:hypothetical protein